VSLFWIVDEVRGEPFLGLFERPALAVCVIGGLIPVVEVDGRTIGAGERGPLTARLTDLYAEAVAEAAARKPGT